MDDPRKQTLKSKYRGALLGVAVGDALGAPYEGSTSLDPRRLRELISHPGPLRYTDDTHMTLGLAQSLVPLSGSFVWENFPDSAACSWQVPAADLYSHCLRLKTKMRRPRFPEVS